MKHITLSILIAIVIFVVGVMPVKAYKGGTVQTMEDLHSIQASIVETLREVNLRAGHLGDNIVCAFVSCPSTAGYSFRYAIVYEEAAPEMLGTLWVRIDPLNKYGATCEIIYANGTSRVIR